MTVEPRAALDRLVAAFEAHLGAIVGRRGEDDPAVDEAYYVLADAFDVYDEAIASTYGEALPFYVAEDDEDDDEDEDDEDYEDVDDDYDFGGETLYEVKCPTCGEEITIDEEMLDEGSTTCPNCGEELEFEMEEEDDEDQ